jgi:hypothetical protein
MFCVAACYLSCCTEHFACCAILLRACNCGVKIHDPWCQFLRSTTRLRRFAAVTLVRVTDLCQEGVLLAFFVLNNWNIFVFQQQTSLCEPAAPEVRYLCFSNNHRCVNQQCRTCVICVSATNIAVWTSSSGRALFIRTRFLLHIFSLTILTNAF